MNLDPNKFDNALQLGGIRTGTLDTPAAGGGQSVRVALVDTGSGLRFTVALDRGGDIIDATYQQHALAYLTPNGLLPPNTAYHVGVEWLRGWAGGLVTTCGPEYMGGPREVEGGTSSLHGRFSSQVAQIERIKNPDPKRGDYDMELALIIRDTRMFGPNFVIRRTLRCRLGEPILQLDDEVTNIGDTEVAHHWLYHCNFGYPLLDEGCRFYYRGKAEYWVVPPPAGQDIIQPASAAEMTRLKTVPKAVASHVGSGERGLIVETEAARDGQTHLAIVNPKLKLAVEMSYPKKAMPRMANWQHFAPNGSFVSALEPFSGSLLGSARDKHRLAKQSLAAGESKTYSLSFRIHSGNAALATLKAFDGPVIPYD